MRDTARVAAVAGWLSALLAATALPAASVQADDQMQARIKEGKEIAFDRAQGNCLACHMIDKGESPGNIGPPLVAMKARFPKRDDLYNRIYDAPKINPATRMPPFGTHRILSQDDINKIVDYLYTL